MKFAILLTVSSLMLPFALHSQTVRVNSGEYGASVVCKGLSQHIRIEPSSTGGLPTLAIKLPDALPAADPESPFQELFIKLAVQDTHRLACALHVTSWKLVANLSKSVANQSEIASIKYIGSKAWKPYATVRVVPFKVTNGCVFVADTFTVDVTWKIGPTKSLFAQPVVVENSWYQPEQPHVRVKTRIDGVAKIESQKVIAAQPRLNGVLLNELALFYKAHEQPIAIFDADNDGKYGVNDVIVFAGKHATGDSTWLDLYDTTAVFFLTTRSVGERKRLTLFDGQPTPTDSISDLLITNRYERDSGYYHLGTARNILYSEFNSDIAPFEGYYWSQMKADANKSEKFSFRLCPKENSTLKITADYVSSSYADKYKPNSRAELSVNGLTTASLETDTVGRYSFTKAVGFGEYGMGLQSIKFFAPGIVKHLGKQDYVSDILLDGFVVEGQAMTVLDSGRIAGTIRATTTPVRLDVMNSRSGGGYVIDTTNSRIYRLSVTSGATTIQASLTPPDIHTLTSPLETSYMRAAVIINDTEVVFDSVAGYFLAWKEQTNSGVVSATYSNATEVQQAVQNLPVGVAFAIGNVGRSSSSGLASALQQRGTTIPDAKFWVAGVLENKLSKNFGNNSFGALGILLTSRGSTATTILPPNNSFFGFVADLNGIENARVEPSSLSNLQVDNPQADVIYVTHREHIDETKRLAAHRAKMSSVTTRIVDVDQIIDEFGTGHRSPDALRNFLRAYYVAAPEPKPTTLLLVGNATWDPRIAIPKGNANSRRPDQVPTYGRPSSDYWFGLLDDPTDYAMPELVVGRIPAITRSESKAVVDKIISNDTTTYQPWMRKFLFVGGGSSQEGLCSIYKDILKDPFNTGITYVDPPLCLDSVTLCKPEAPPNAGYLLKQTINAGVQWMNYIGHGSTDVFDITGWDANELNNEGKYGVLATYACQTGAFSNPSTLSKNAQYLIEPGKGFAAAVGGTGWAYIQTIGFLHYRIHETIRNTSKRSIGDIIYEAKVNFASRGDQDGVNTVMQYCILGDPLMRIEIDTVVDVMLRASDVEILTTDGSRQLSESDSIALVNVRIQNRGLGTESAFPIVLQRRYKGETDTLVENVSGICKDGYVQFTLAISDMVGEHLVSIVADPMRVLNDDSSNNSVTLVFSVFAKGALHLEPMPYGEISNTAPHIRMIDGLWDAENNETKVTFYLTKKQDLSQLIIQSSSDEVIRDQSIATWIPTFGQGLPKGPAWLAANVYSPATNDTSAMVWVPIIIGETNSSNADVRAERMLEITPENVEFDSISKTQQLVKKVRNIYVRASGIGPSGDGTDSTLQFTIGDVQYISNQFFRGINVVLIDSRDTVPRLIRRYDTYFDPDNTEGWHNGTSKALIKFLRDSVLATDNVYMFTWLESVTGFIKDTTLAEFQEVMHEYGSAFVDSLRESSSWLYVGRKGIAIGAANEIWKNAPDRDVVLNEPHTFIRTQGTVATEWIGPARKWESVEFDNSETGLHASIFGRREDGQVDFVDSMPAGLKIWNAADKLSPYKFLKLEWKLNIENLFDPLPFIRGAKIKYEPADEWIVEESSIQINPSEVLRADTASLNFEIKNARKLQSALPIDVTINVSSPTPDQSAYLFAIPLRALNSEEVLPISTSLPSTLASTNAKVLVKANTSNQPEMYGHNNQEFGVFRVTEDTIPPTIQVKADNILVTVGGYVRREPRLEVIVRDNSKLPVNDSSRLVVFINGDRIKSSTSTDYEFFGTAAAQLKFNDNSVRSAIVFRYKLEDGQNNLVVRATDATQNSASIEPELYVSVNNGFGDLSVNPNPSNGPVTFNVELIGLSETTTSNILIHDMQGRHIQTLEFDAHIGSNSVLWDGLNERGQSIGQGMYVFRVTTFNPNGEPLANLVGTIFILH